MILKTIIGFLTKIWNAVVTALGLGGVVGIVATIVVGILIWLIQELRNSNALRHQREYIREDLRILLPKAIAEGLAREHENRTGRPATAEMREDFKMTAGAAATIIDHKLEAAGITIGAPVLGSPSLRAESTWGLAGIGPGGAATEIAFAGEDEKKVPNACKSPKGKPIFAGDDEEKP
jgi:hypothetical protein